MRISILGAGYVGLTTAAGFAEKGHDVICVDIQKEKVGTINSGKSPIYEDGVEEILKKTVGKNLKASTDLGAAVMESEATFICVGTPSNADGSLNTGFAERASTELGEVLSEKEGYHLIILKSTMLPGMTEGLIGPLLEKASGKKSGKGFGLAFNPEFLREGVALQDVRSPDRIVIGCSDQTVWEALKSLYAPFKSRILKTSIKEAEMIKYASNTFLATKISFINEIGNICKENSIDAYKVSEGMGLDHRISPHFLKAGLGWGGSCFPKDLRALITESKRIGYQPMLLEAVVNVNDKQPERLIRLAKKKAGHLKGKNVSVLGLAFKAGTDDTRDSPAFKVIDMLLSEEAKVIAYDPKAAQNARTVYGERIEYAKTAKDALIGSELALIVTDWDEFKNLDYGVMKKKMVIDARNIVCNRKDVNYEGLCW